MIGQDYFDLRSRLGTALFSLGGLVPEAGTDPDHAVILDNLVNSLKDPFVFVVVGEVNVGKSTFLNALFGAEFSRMGVMPTTDKVLFFKHGPSERHVVVTNTLEEVYVPADFLKDFHIVDTPGTNSIETEHQEITERFVPMADLVIFVFSAMNPWGASAWQFLEKVHRHWMRHVMFVLQQCDLRTPEEIEAILDYMKQLCRQRFQHEFPIFPVAAKKALLARTGGLDRERLMTESGFSHLEKYISRSLGGSAPRISKLANALRIAWEILGAIQRQSGTRIGSREDKSRVLRHIEDELAAHQERTSAKLAPAIEATEGDLQRASEDVMNRMNARLTPRVALGCVFVEKRKVVGLEEILLQQVRTPAIERWDKAAVIIEDDVGGYADFLMEQVQNGLKVQLREELRPDDSFWKAQRRRFAQRMDELLHQIVSGLHLESDLKPVLVKSRRLAAVQLLVVLPALIGAIVLASLGKWTLAGVVEGTGLVLGGVLWFASGRLLSAARQKAADKLTLARPELRKFLTEQLRDDVRNLYDSFNRILEPTREKLLDKEKRQTAFTEQVENLVNSFNVLDAQLREMSAAGG